MGVHYSKQSSAVNSLVWLPGTIPYSQRLVTKSFNIQARLVDQHLVVGVGFSRVVRYPLYQYCHQYDRLRDRRELQIASASTQLATCRFPSAVTLDRPDRSSAWQFCWG